MRRRSSSSRRSLSLRRPSDSETFDEFGFAVTKRKEQKVHHRCHHYSSPQLSSGKHRELCELLSYWNASSFLCRSQMERFIRMGIPSSLRGRVWKSLLNIHALRETTHFHYLTCLSEVRQPLVDLGISEYGILSAITMLSDTQNRLTSVPSESDISLFRQIALDLQRSFPTHRSLMGETPEAIEGRAKLFRVLVAHAKYNPEVGYSQGMSHIAAVLLMQLGEEEEAFWALAALLGQPKYLAEMFDLTITKVQHQAKVFEQFFKHRKPQLFQHLESVGVLSVHYVMPWFLTLFTSLPCWDTVLAVWDLFFLFGLPAVFRSALTIMELLEPRLLGLTDEGAVLPLLLRVPVHVAQYSTFVPALWRLEVQDWELKCLNSLVLDENHGYRADICFNFGDLKLSSSSPMKEDDGENLSASLEEEKTAPKDSVLTRVMRVAQRYLFDPLDQRHVKGKCSQSQAESRQLTAEPNQTAASVKRPQVRSRWQSHRRVKSHPTEQQRSGGDFLMTFREAAGGGNRERCEQTLTRTWIASHRRSNHRIIRRVRTKSLDPLNLTPPAPFHPSGSRSSSTSSAEHLNTSSAALMKEASLGHQSGTRVGNTRESRLI
uniref:Small G protein signaling modulator 3 n=1 Tax=Oryzias latipes TaxID=8090 RepID=A0A3P9H2K9_ORYLA